MEHERSTEHINRCERVSLEIGVRSNPESKQMASIGAIYDEVLGFLGSLQHGQLMTQRDDLGLECSSAPKAVEKGIHKD